MQNKKYNTVLLVDDDPITNYMNERLIKSMGIAENILVMSNGENAFQYLKDCADHRLPCPELILLDINMPVSDGFSFLKRVRHLNFTHHHFTVAVLTTSTNENDMHEMKLLGVQNFINKPLTKEKFFGISDTNLSTSAVAS